ncbi:MAG: two-component regulator propeller domain-containing protein [Crocinitomix sp.]|nr:two-component regulator propeller domain-containing protein [Crocinitomix sp.]
MKKGILIASVVLIAQLGFAQTFTNYSTADGLISDNAICVYANGADDLWFGTQLGVSNFDVTTWTNYDVDSHPGMADNNILSIYVDDMYRTWIGTDFGTSVLDGGSWITYTTDDGLGNNKVQCINQDGSSNMWFGTITGLSKFDGIEWTTFGTGDGLPFGGVRSITVNADGNLWLGTGLGGIAIYDGTTFTEITEDEGLISDKIRAIDFSPSGETWVATAEGVSMLNDADAVVASHTTIFTLPDPDTLNPVTDVKVDDNGVVWAGVYVDYLVTEGGVCAYNGSTWFQFDESDGLAGPVVNGLDIDENNDVWVVTSTGITKISDHTLGLDKIQTTELSFYPNPANGIVNIIGSTDQLGDAIAFYNLQGENVYQSTVQTNMIVQVADWSPGLYFIVVNDLREKLIVQ